ncbi:hypothetical protein [Paenibacillus qinlingensis]|uniref:Uncharacterized protein (DUF2225 family) n=1 Tax=Paenibacillus qinlingensis TaxID=1837343 RepID=A0ABU1NZ19_9BACL|nr:hypothetical protein [Paenibacillus qinlingensis]MDR6552725.1 uncharacterized protein (DUF2225 family) [Paenibacillus qinlingensis]
MPYVLQQKETEQIYTTTLVNHYGLAYYGVKFWIEQEEANEQAYAYLESQAVQDPDSWQVIEWEESEMKISNVKLKNSSVWQLFWSGITRKPEVRKLEI